MHTSPDLARFLKNLHHPGRNIVFTHSTPLEPRPVPFLEEQQRPCAFTPSFQETFAPSSGDSIIQQTAGYLQHPHSILHQLHAQTLQQNKTHKGKAESFEEARLSHYLTDSFSPKNARNRNCTDCF